MNKVETYVRQLLSDDDFMAIDTAIKTFEKKTSGELVVSFQVVCRGDPYKEGRRVFNRLKLYNTRERNAILVVIFVNSRKFAVLGDRGINEKVPGGFWDETVAAMADHFREERYREGLVEGIQILGGQLVTYFPYRANDMDELSDEVRFG
ncbi:MAG: TPM domain-containing protein [Candidatus Neomarinimicrobiota bacterium]